MFQPSDYAITIFAVLFALLILTILKFNNRQYKQFYQLLQDQRQWNLTMVDLLKNNNVTLPALSSTNYADETRLHFPRATDADEAEVEEMRRQIEREAARKAQG